MTYFGGWRRPRRRLLHATEARYQLGIDRRKPARLSEKLLTIRNALGLSQTEVVKRLSVEEMIVASQISEFETGKREPSLIVLLQYARLAGVHMEDLVDDEAVLPEKLPGRVKHERLKPAPVRR